ncbi:unnamed protein product, partial [Mesorhabditis belari]|uniref:Epoxide hydrolase n=1 Tax=Mesorhabditis belari TaxID=2138241 RepID=A0AAF3F267_9BILA
MIGAKTVIFLIVPIILLNYLINQRIERPAPAVEKNGYFGEGDTRKDDEAIEAFQIEISKERLDDLQKRLQLERLLPKLDSTNRPSFKFLELLRENFGKFDWKQHEYFLNTFKHYRTEIEGLKIHYIRQTLPPTTGKQVVPILLLHGFPGSFWHFYKIAPLLSNPHRYGFDFGVKAPLLFDVIIPSLPGFLWSDKPTRSGMWTGDIARILAKLLKRLKIESTFVHGGAILGAEVASSLAVLYPKLVRGVHLSNPFLIPFCDLQTTAQHSVSYFGYNNDVDRSSTEIFEVARLFQEFYPRSGDAIGSSLYNSPWGLTANLMSFWHEYSNGNYTAEKRKQLNEMFTVDELLTEIHLYWLSDTAPHALRLLENINRHPDLCALSMSTVTRPTSIVSTPSSPFRFSRFQLSHKFHNITRYNILPKGGLFHSLQDAHSLAADIFAFVELETL